MKAKDYILIGGGAVALFLLYKNKTKKVGTTITGGTTTTGGSTTGAITTGLIGGTTAGTSQVTVLETPPPSNEPEQVFGLGLPTGMDLPILTAGTGIPTEVAVQQGGVYTTPTPAITPTPPLEIEEGLEPLKINYPIDAPRPYRPTLNLQEYPSYGREPNIIMENNYNPRPSYTDDWVITRPRPNITREDY
jgi:hypothetical protein